MPQEPQLKRLSPEEIQSADRLINSPMSGLNINTQAGEGAGAGLERLLEVLRWRGLGPDVDIAEIIAALEAGTGFGATVEGARPGVDVAGFGQTPKRPAPPLPQR